MLSGLIACGLALGGGSAGALANGGFEDKLDKAGAPTSWTLSLGAQNGATTPLSKVELDTKEKHAGKASLHVSGDGSTRGWQILEQPIEVRIGGKYTLTAWTKTEGVKPNEFKLNNCYVGVMFFDASDKLVGKELAWPTQPGSPWTSHTLSLTAPANARRGSVFVFLSMLGELWVDDLELAIDGGEAVPAPEVLFREDFAKVKRLPSEWKKKIGATNGSGGTESKIEIDPVQGAADSPSSLHLAGDANTRRWNHLSREFPSEPGDRCRWSGVVRTESVLREGPQFANLHLNLAFVDAKGEIVGEARFAQIDPGTHDWAPVAVEAIAPEGTKKVQAGLFLSMSGDAWFDQLELTREKGAPPPYSDWITLEGKGVTLRYSPADPHASEMKAKLAALEQSRRETCRALEVEFPETITVFLYKDMAEGKLLTGANLDFADPKNRRVHQQWNSYIGHEMVHVIAHNTLQYGHTGILGEGIAVWLNGAAKNHHTDARELLEKSQLPSVSDLLARFRELDAGYPAAGSFCGFLIETYGLARFKEVYPLTDPSAKFKELEGKSFEELEPEWHAYIRKF